MVNVMESASFICNASGVLLPSLNWSTTIQDNGTDHIFNERIDVNVNTQNDKIVSTLTIQSVQLNDEGSYVCTRMYGEQIGMLSVYNIIVGM